MAGVTLNAPNTRLERQGAVVTSGDATTVIWGPYDLLAYRDKTFTLYNLGDVTLSGAVVQINPDEGGYEQNAPGLVNQTRPAPNAGLWHAYDSTTFRSLGSGQVRSLAVANNDRYRWWRIIGTQNNPSTTVSGWGYAST